MVYRIVQLIFATQLSTACQAQDLLTGEINAPCATKESSLRRVIPYPNLREADVLWARRIWSYIDLRQKMNHPLYYPLEPNNDNWALFDLIGYGLSHDWITAYGLGPLQDDDEFRYPLTKEEVDSITRPKMTRYRERVEDGTMEAVESIEPLTAADVVGYMIKEDWLFDKQRSQHMVRLIGLAPVVLRYSETGEIKGSQPLFWLYYPECRYLFSPCEAYIGHSTAIHLSFDQLFTLRRYQAQIIKEDNVFDRAIDEYAKGMDALLEAERIKQTLFEWEHDLWTY
jgi:gliding motility associated protien GldN